MAILLEDHCPFKELLGAIWEPEDTAGQQRDEAITAPASCGGPESGGPGVPPPT